MPGIILGLGSIRMRPIDEPLLINWYDLGSRFAVALRVPSLKRDVVTLNVIEVISLKITRLELSIHPETRNLTDGKFEYEVREPGSENEINSCLHVIERSGINEDDED